MLSIILIAFFSLIGLLIFHEFSHFIVAKKFGIEADEFGIGYPPRIWAKKIGKTIYSLNALPFGAFVRIPDERLKSRPIWQRFFVLIAGIVSFWFFCVVLLSIVLMLGASVQIEDEDVSFDNPKVQIVGVAPGSPAEEVGLRVGDVIDRLQVTGHRSQVDTVSRVQEFIGENRGEEIVFTIERGRKNFSVSAIPRISPPEGEGALGISLVRVGMKKYPLWQALVRGPGETIRLTGMIIFGLARALKNLFLKRPTGMELVGPIGMMEIFVQTGSLGVSRFLQTMALISLHLAVFNALPIPVADGGKILLLALEKVRKKPLNKKIEQGVSSVFFFLLLGLMVWVTVKDISKLF